MPALDVACVQAFLHEFARSYPESLNLLVWDGAPAHTAHALIVPSNVVLIQLPAYSPELNPIERLWQDLRYRLGSELPPSLHALREKTAALIRAYSPEQLASLCGYSYLLTLFHHAQQF
jgi:transposase